MAIKAGQILHVANKFVVDRIQTGAAQLNIPQNKVYELGNYQSVGVVRDIPDLTFNLDCLDVDTEVEALLCGSTNPSADAQSTVYDLSLAKPIDIISPWKSPYGAFGIVKGVALPQLTLESASYKFGLKDDSGESFALRGDGMYYIPGTPMQDTFVGDGTTTVFTLTSTALVYTNTGVTTYALNVSVDGVRKVKGTDYTETATAITLLTPPASLAKVSIVYGTATAGSYASTVHEGLSVKPAAIKGTDIDVYFSTSTVLVPVISNVALTSNVATITSGTAHGLIAGDTVTLVSSNSIFNGTFTVLAGGLTTTAFTFNLTHANVVSVAATGSLAKAVEIKWPEVQTVTVDWKVTLEDDYEFGNPRSVSKEATDVPAVTGAIELKARSVDSLFVRLAQVTGVSLSEVIGPQSSVAGALRIVLRNPASGGTTAVAVGTALKTLYVPAARFTLPGYSGQVQTKLLSTVNYESDDGVLLIYKGVKP